jgi:pimeloyl-ACP methyl ester carboxylesterase
VSLVDSLEFYIAPDLEERGQRFSAMMPDLMNYDIHEQLREVTAPTYIEYGAAEPAASLSGQRLRIEFPNARLVIIEGKRTIVRDRFGGEPDRNQVP